MNNDVQRSASDLFGHVYNSPGAQDRFAVYYNTIDNRATFFGASNQYEQNVGSKTRWFGGAESVSRAAMTGLGADGNGSWLTFLGGSALAGIDAHDIYDWRSTAGNSLMTSGFGNFKTLYNSGTSTPVAWDINQLRNEQRTLQPIHEKFLEGHPIFTNVSSVMTNTNYFPFLGERGIEGGVNILDYKSRIEYGCKLLGYGAAQGCSP